MIKLHEGPQLVLNDDVLASVSEHPEIYLAAAKQQTLSYQVLQAHNHSGDMENLQIRFDEMGVYDNTYVGILQTAVASGLQKFPMPTVFTNCHNCLCAVGVISVFCQRRYGWKMCGMYCLSDAHCIFNLCVL